MYTVICPTCDKRIEYTRMVDAGFRPFCSERCQSVDLGRWLAEEYRISDPTPDAPPNDIPEA